MEIYYRATGIAFDKVDEFKLTQIGLDWIALSGPSVKPSLQANHVAIAGLFQCSNGQSGSMPDFAIDNNLGVRVGQLPDHQAIHYGTLAREGWTTQRLLVAHHVIVCAPWIAQAGDNLAQVLRRYPKIEYSYANTAWRGLVDDTLRHDPIKKKGALTVGSMSEAVSAAKAGLGIALVIEELVQDELRTGTLSVLNGIRLKRQDFYLSHQIGVENLDSYKDFSQWLTHRCGSVASIAL